MKTGLMLPRKFKLQWYFLLLTCPVIWGQDTVGWQGVKPNIIDRKILITQYYEKKLYSVLPDTVRSASCCRHKTWVALGRVVIPSGTILEVPPDVKLLFEPNASIFVQGTLKAAGTGESPIQMGIIDKGEMYIAPKTGEFSWKGITVGENGRLVLKNVLITGSQSGVVTNGLCDSLVIENVTFSGMSSAAVSYPGQTIPVNLNVPFTLSCSRPDLDLKPIDRNGFRIASNWFLGEAAVLLLAGAVTTAIRL